LFQLLKSTSNPKPPFAKFGTGNRETLTTLPQKYGVNTRDKLIQFHDSYYSSNTGKLAIIGSETLDQLQDVTVSLFAPVLNKNRQIPTFPSDALDHQTYGKQYKIVPIKDSRTLTLLWQMPPMLLLYKKKPHHMLSHLIGHESRGSILSLLKKKGWANALASGLNQSTTSFSIFGVSMDLSEEGLKHTDEIIEIVYQYLSLLNAASDDRWQSVYDEVRDIATMNFKFKSKETPSSYVSGLAGDMHHYGKHDKLFLSREFLYSYTL